MTTTIQNVPLTIPRQPQPAPQSVTITSQVIYMKGPWGSERPVRNFANVDVKARHYFNNLGKYTTVETIGSALLDGEGRFTITTSPVPVDTDDIFLEITENYTNEVFTYQLIDPKNPAMSHVDRNFVGKQYLGDTKHRLRVPWTPQRADLAIVNSVQYADTQKLARTFATSIQQTPYPFIITLLRESADGYLGGNYTEAEYMFDELITRTPPKDLPTKLVDQLKTVPSLEGINAGSAAQSIARALDRCVTINIDQLETGTFLNSLLHAIAQTFNRITATDMVDDAAPDMAAACTLLFLAALIAKDNAKCTVSRGSLSYEQMQMRYYDAIYISVTR